MIVCTLDALKKGIHGQRISKENLKKLLENIKVKGGFNPKRIGSEIPVLYDDLRGNIFKYFC